jgi:hypothetical protein
MFREEETRRAMLVRVGRALVRRADFFLLVGQDSLTRSQTTYKIKASLKKEVVQSNEFW